jgi:hypothetical protein
VQEDKVERLTQMMSDIAEKDKSIFNLNKQLSNMQILLTTQNPDEVTQNLSELNGLMAEQTL